MAPALLGDLGILGSENTEDNTFFGRVSKNKVACVFTAPPSPPTPTPTLPTKTSNCNPHVSPWRRENSRHERQRNSQGSAGVLPSVFTHHPSPWVRSTGKAVISPLCKCLIPLPCQWGSGMLSAGVRRGGNHGGSRGGDPVPNQSTQLGHQSKGREVA